MKLFESPFERIKSGEKTVEVRLFDEKRRLLNVDDWIEFSKLPELKEKLFVKVLKLDKFDSFRDLLDTYPENLGLSRFKSKDEWIKSVRKIYSVEEEKKYGVLAIHFKLEIS